MSHFKTIRFREKKMTPVNGGLFLFFILSFFSCGLLDDLGSLSPLTRFLGSQEEEKEEAGVFKSPSGPLESEHVCIDNPECIQLCDSMLDRFSDQEKCYRHKEKEVQTFRDTYNVLAIGNPRKLIRVEVEEMKEFLRFGPELWKTAINGFERGRVEDCTENLTPDDIRDYEDCKFDIYYKQDGYWSAGAAATLEWIAKNSWLAKLMIEQDDDHVIIYTLLNVLIKGGQGEEENRISNGKSGVSVCNRALVANGGNGTLDLNSLPNGVSVPPQQKDRYEAFGANCIENHSLSYMLLAIEEDNKDSVNLGHQVVDELCDSRSHCIEYFYCQIDNSINSIKVIDYMHTSGIPDWDRDYNDCQY